MSKSYQIVETVTIQCDAVDCKAITEVEIRNGKPKYVLGKKATMYSPWRDNNTYCPEHRKVMKDLFGVTMFPQTVSDLIVGSKFSRERHARVEAEEEEMWRHNHGIDPEDE